MLKRIVLVLGIALGVSNCVPQEALKTDSFTRASSGICDPLYAGVQKSQCLWVATGESVGLQWDVDVCASDNGNPAQFTKLYPDQPNGCDQSTINADSAPTCSHLNACYTGALRVNGVNAVMPPWGSTQGAPTTIVGCTGAESFNPLNECRALTQNCQPVPHQECRGAEPPYNYPYCSAGCVQEIDHDETLELLPAPPLQAILLSPPAFYTVTDTRKIVRPGQFNSDGSDFQSGRLAWIYQVARGADRVLAENFSPNLFVSRVRAFITSGAEPTGSWQYLNLFDVKAEGDALVDCGGSAADATEVTTDSCPILALATPAYLKDATTLRPSPSGQGVVWRVKAVDAAHSGNVGLTRSSQVYFEFTLANAKGGSGQLYLQPTAYDFGVLASGARRTDQGVLKLRLADSPVDWVVESTSTTGNNAQEFSVQVDGASTIRTGGTRGINVTLNPASDGSKTATGTITLRDPAGNRVNLSAELYATSGALPLNVVPDTIRYQNEVDRNTRQPLPLPWRKRFLITNNAISPIVRQSVAVSGADASAFQIYEGGSGNSPIAPTFTIGTGASELFSVDFCPTRRGSFSAQITVTGNEGTAAVPAIGAATVILHGTAPDAPAALCP